MTSESTPLTPEQFTSADEIKALIKAHPFTSSSKSVAGSLTDTLHRAACACGVEFQWRTRYQEHEQHQLAVVAIWSDARAAIAKAEAHAEVIDYIESMDPDDLWSLTEDSLPVVVRRAKQRFRAAEPEVTYGSTGGSPTFPANAVAEIAADARRFRSGSTTESEASDA